MFHWETNCNRACICCSFSKIKVMYKINPLKKNILSGAIVVLLLAVCSTCHGIGTDSVVITGRLQGNTRYANVMVLQFGVGLFPVYQTVIHKDSFRIAAPANIPRGVYRLQYSAVDNKYIDVIINGELRIDFTVEVADGNSHFPVFQHSDENMAWYGYRAELAEYELRSALLMELIRNYPDSGDAVVKQAQASLLHERMQIMQSRRNFIREQGSSISGRMVANQPLGLADPWEHPRINAWKLRQHYWDAINTEDTSLIFTPLYQEHMLNYISYYMNPEVSYSEKEMEDGFRQSVDTIVSRFSSSQVMRKFAIDYLWQGFKEIGQEKMTQYIDETYRSAIGCGSEQESDELERRLQAYQAMRPGHQAPEIRYTDTADVEVDFFRDVGADTFIVAFWASWCPHCRDAMPKLDSFAIAHKNFAVIAVSLDDDADEFSDFSKGLAHMTHYCDYRKWESPPAVDYHITATPTFFLLGPRGVIIGKYSSFRALQEVLEQDKMN